MLGGVQQKAMHCSILLFEVIKKKDGDGGLKMNLRTVVSLGFDGSLYSWMVVGSNFYIFLFMRGLFTADFLKELLTRVCVYLPAM